MSELLSLPIGYAELRPHQEVVHNLKLPILADREAYEYAYNLFRKRIKTASTCVKNQASYISYFA